MEDGFLFAAHPHLSVLDRKPRAKWGRFGQEGNICEDSIRSTLSSFYMTDPISRVSETMASCVEVFARGEGRV